MLSHMEQMDAIKEKPESFEMNGARHDSTGLRKRYSDAETGKDVLFPVIASVQRRNQHGDSDSHFHSGGDHDCLLPEVSREAGNHKRRGGDTQERAAGHERRLPRLRDQGVSHRKGRSHLTVASWAE